MRRTADSRAGATAGRAGSDVGQYRPGTADSAIFFFTDASLLYLHNQGLFFIIYNVEHDQSYGKEIYDINI